MLIKKDPDCLYNLIDKPGLKNQFELFRKDLAAISMPNPCFHFHPDGT
jgi:hypothetical protein